MQESAFWDRYNGKREVLGEALFNHDPYDQFAWCQSWRFAICDVLTFIKGETVPGFYSHGPDTDSFEYEMLSSGTHSTESLRYALKILDRYREWLRRAGEDY